MASERTAKIDGYVDSLLHFRHRRLLLLREMSVARLNLRIPATSRLSTLGSITMPSSSQCFHHLQGALGLLTKREKASQAFSLTRRAGLRKRGLQARQFGCMISRARFVGGKRARVGRIVRHLMPTTFKYFALD